MDFANETNMSFDLEETKEKAKYTEEIAAEAAGTAALYAGDTSVYEPIKQDFLQLGESKTYDAMVADASVSRVSAMIPEAARLAGDPEAPGIVRDAIEEAKAPNLEAEALYKSADRYQPSTVSDVIHTQSADEFISMYEQNSTAVTSAIMELYGEVGDVGVKEFALGFLDLAIPTNETQYMIRLRNKMKKALGREEAAAPLSGEILNDLRKEFNRGSTEEKLDFIQSLAQAMADTSTYFGQDSLVEVGNLQFIFDDFLNGKKLSDPEAEISFLNLVTIADTVPLVGALAAGAKAMSGARKLSKIDKVNAANPTEARALAAEAAGNPEVAAAAGTTQVDAMIDNVLPKWRTANGEEVAMVEAPSKVLDTLEIVAQYGKEAKDRLSRFGYVTTGEEKRLMGELQKEYMQATNSFSYKQGTSSIDYGDDFMTVRAQYAKTDDGAGWATPDEALDAIRSEFPEAEVKLRQRALGIQSDNVPAVDYVAEVVVQKAYNDPKGMLFGPNSVYLNSKLAEVFADPATRYAQDISRGFTGAFDIEKGVQAKLSQMMKPLTSLKNKSKQKVIGWLDEGMSGTPTNPAGFVFSPPELVARGATPDEMAGYYSARVLNDTFYVINNRKLRNDMFSRGFNRVVELSDDNKQFMDAVPYRELRAGEAPTSALNPSTGRIEQIPEGTPVGRLFEAAEDAVEPAKATEYVMLSTRTRSLPSQVLRYDQGYVSTRYTDSYLVRKSGGTRIIDGVARDVTNTVATASTRGQALKMANKLNQEIQDKIALKKSQLASATGSEVDQISKEIKELEKLQYGPVYEGKLKTDRVKAADYEMERVKGRLFFSKKGERLKNIDGLAEIQDPISAMDSAKAAVSRAGVYGPVVDTMKNRLMNTYGKYLPADYRHKGRYPETADLFDPEVGGLGRTDKAIKDVADAKSLWRAIDNFESPSDSVANWWMSRFVSLADSLGDGILAKGALAISKKDPMSFARGFNFVSLLALNPVRQIFVQSQQILFLSGISPKYIFSGGIAKDYLALSAGFLAKPSKKAKGMYPFTLDQIAPAGAKMMGVSVDEYKATVRAFRDSGLPNSMDSHMLSHDAAVQLSNEVTRSLGQAAVKNIKKAGSLAVEIPRKLGFDFGEYNNLTMSWLVARRKALDNGAKSLSVMSVADDVGITARQYALDMTAQGSFSHQRGILSLATQFLSVQQKAWLAVIPGRAGNKAFTNADKARIFASQVALYGASGWGLTEIWDAAKKHFKIETTQEQDALVRAGLYEWAVNAALTAITGEDQDLAVTKNIAAGGGLMDSFGALIDDTFDGERSAFEIFAGATSTNLDRISQATGYVKWILADDALDNDEKLFRATEIVTGMAGSVSNYTKYRMASNLGMAVTRNGSPIVRNTFAERAAQGLLGISTQEEEAYWRTIQDIKAREEAIKGDARFFYDMLLRDVTRFDLDVGASLQDRTGMFQNYLDNQFSTMMTLLGPEDASAMWSEIQEIRRFERDQTGQSRLAQRVVQLVNEGRFPEPWEMLQRQVELGELDQNTMDNIIRASNELIESRERNYGGQ